MQTLFCKLTEKCIQKKGLELWSEIKGKKYIVFVGKSIQLAIKLQEMELFFEGSFIVRINIPRSPIEGSNYELWEGRLNGLADLSFAGCDSIKEITFLTRKI